MSDRGLTLVVQLFVRPGHERAFDDFEARAQAIMGDHGGRIERRVRTAARDDGSRPYEVHLVTFPDAASFDRYRADPRALELAATRSEIIRETIVWPGLDVNGAP